ncbi:MAG: ABC transporter ATP-binding protein [Actinobacteria bacterium]|nr:ABC transporter ATP-binding protein [Actinomycetota bacterium]
MNGDWEKKNGRPVIQTQKACKNYGEKRALIDLDLTIAEGEVFGLLGHNGAGKTTAVSIITTLLSPTSGTVEVCGFDTMRQGREVRSIIGYLPENVEFYDRLTLEENLSYFARLSGLSRPGGRIRDVLEFLEFTGHEKKRLETFSKGMRQRAGIAQAIMHMPRVLFLDEPTSGLDPQGVINLREIIISLNHELGMTIFMNTHSLSEVTKTCTSIGILRDGRLLYQDSLVDTMKAFPGENSLEDIYLRIDSGRR